MEVVLGVAGVGSAARLGVQAGARVGARATGWSRALRGALLSLDDAAQLGRAVVSSVAGAGEADPEAPVASAVAPWRARWGWGDHLAVWGGAVCLLLLLAAPWLTHQDTSALLALLGAELHPLP